MRTDTGYSVSVSFLSLDLQVVKDKNKERGIKHVNNHVRKITYNLLTNSRLDLDFFMFLPMATWLSKDKTSIKLNLNPVIYLRYKQPKFVSEYDYTKASYKITPRNIMDVIKFFNQTVKWLFGEEYKDLFLYNDNGELIFNADYGKLHATLATNDYNNQFMQAIPAIVKLGDKTYEGIHLFVNKSNYCIPLTYQEVTMLFGVLKDFSFSETTSMVLAAYQYIEAHEAIEAQGPLSQGKIKTPFD